MKNIEMRSGMNDFAQVKGTILISTLTAMTILAITAYLCNNAFEKMNSVHALRLHRIQEETLAKSPLEFTEVDSGGTMLQVRSGLILRW